MRRLLRVTTSVARLPGQYDEGDYDGEGFLAMELRS